MGATGRRLSNRNRLDRPVEAHLSLCRGQQVRGWIVDEQDDGVGMMFGAEDVAALRTHEACCVGGPADLWLAEEGREGHPVPVRLAHVTPEGPRQTCRAGLAFDVGRMKASDIAHLLGVWRRLVVATDRGL